MADESYTYAQAKARLDEIVLSVRKKDISLETSLDLLEEGVRLANQCTELIDQAEWDQMATPVVDESTQNDEEAEVATGSPAEAESTPNDSQESE